MTRSATASAAAWNIGDRTRVASASANPSPMPGKTYADVLGRTATLFPVCRSTKGSFGHPAANAHAPSVASYAWRASHSAMPSGRLRAKISGAGACGPRIALSTSSVKSLGGGAPESRAPRSATPATPPAGSSAYPSYAPPSVVASAPTRSECLCRRTPMSAVGLTASTASRTVKHSPWSPGCAKGSLWSARSGSDSALCLVTRPLESTIHTSRRVSATVRPVSAAAYSAIISPMPVPVSPAPAIRYVCSLTPFPVFGRAAMMPASAVAATPWMSSLNTAARDAYRSRRRFPLALEKSSN